MRFGRRFLLAAVGSLSVIWYCPTAGALAPKNTGLYISPLRSYLTLSANQTVTRSFQVINLTDKPLTVTASIEQFSVDDYVYDYKFRAPENNWITLVEPQARLAPGQSHDFAYRVALPPTAEIGGHYYTFFASADLSSNGLAGTVRAGTLLYLTVDGDLKRTSQLQSSHVPRLITTPTIPYTFNVKNTGNVHYFAYLSASLQGLGYHADPNGTSQLLMPGTTRHIASSIASPFLPGIYRITYGYQPDASAAIRRSELIVFLPPWSIAAFIISLTLLIKLSFNRRTGRRRKAA